MDTHGLGVCWSGMGDTIGYEVVTILLYIILIDEDVFCYGVVYKRVRTVAANTD